MLGFLKGLNYEFEGRPARLFHQSTLPSFKEAVATMAHEDVRLNLTKDGGGTQSHSDFIAAEHRETRECYNYG